MAARRSMIALATGAVMLLSGFMSSEALAHTQKDPTEVTIEWDGAEFDGEVNSEKQSCVDNRKVRLFRRGESGALASTRADEEGSWSIGIARQNGDYYAKVSKLVLKKNDRHKHFCKPDKSNRSQDALVRDCDEVTLFDGSGSDGSTDVDVDDDIAIYVEGREVFVDNDDFAGPISPMALGPVSFGEDIRIVATNSSSFGFGPVSIDPLSVGCSSAAGSGSAVLDATGFSGEDDEGVVFYDETYAMPVITLTR